MNSLIVAVVVEAEREAFGTVALKLMASGSATGAETGWSSLEQDAAKAANATTGM